jgi:hypothetical protein
MAYLDLRCPSEVPAGSVGGSDSRCDSERQGPARLGRQEWSVIELARNESLWTLNPDGLLQRIARTLFGIRQPLPLANNSLEALRRFALLAWHRGSVGAAQINELIAAGFSCADATQVLQHIVRGRRMQAWPQGMA